MSQLESISLTVDKVTQNIIALGIYNADAPLNGTAYANYLYNQLKSEYTELEASISEYRTRIEAIETAIGNYSGNSSTIVTVDMSSLLSVLTQELIPLVAEQAEIKTRMDSIKSDDTSLTTYYTALETSTLAANSATNAAYMAEVEATLNSVLDSVDAAIDSYNALVSEYNSTTLVSYYASITKSPTTESDALITTSALLIVVVAVIVIAVAVAFGQTWSVMKKAGTLNGEPEAESADGGKEDAELKQ